MGYESFPTVRIVGQIGNSSFRWHAKNTHSEVKPIFPEP